MIYLDHNATSPLDPRVRDVVRQCEEQCWGNPSSVHAPGRRARSAIEDARADLAQMLGAESPERLVFTASGSEANNLAIQGLALAAGGEPFHVVASAIEHDCVYGALEALAACFEWFSFDEIRPDAGGRVCPEAFEAAMRPETRLAAIMHANHETGVIQPVAEIAAVARRRGVTVLCDAVQSFGCIPVTMRELGADLVTLAAHKFYGPKGAGALCMRGRPRLARLIHGGGQERGLRAGTENAPAISGMAVAARIALESLETDRAHRTQLESIFLDTLREAKLPFEINGDLSHKVGGVVNIAIPGAAQADLVAGMDLVGVAVSAGAACSSGVIEPSRVLGAMGLDEWRLKGALRVSFGRGNLPDDVVEAAGALVRLCRRLGVKSQCEALER